MLSDLVSNIHQFNLKLLKIKRMPPILFIFYIPICVFITVLFLMIAFLMWLLGFWLCDGCEKVYWIREDKHKKIKKRGNRYDIEFYCNSCQMIEKLKNP